MIKERITILNIILGIGCFIISICYFWLVGVAIYSILFKPAPAELTIFMFFGVICFLGFLTFIAKSMWRFFLKFLVPSVYCMRYIKKYINRKELKEILENEKFEKIAIKQNEDGEFDFYASENWLYINKVYVPKAIILDIQAGGYKATTHLKLLNKKKIDISNYTENSDDRFCNKIKATKKIIPNVYLGHIACPYSEFEKKYIEKFLNEIQTKEDFLNLVKKDYFFTRKEIKDEFLTEKLQKEKRRYFYDENGKYWEEHTTALGEIFIYEAKEGEEDL